MDVQNTNLLLMQSQHYDQGRKGAYMVSVGLKMSAVGPNDKIFST